jgi:hypothetical protein
MRDLCLHRLESADSASLLPTAYSSSLDISGTLLDREESYGAGETR